MAGQCKDWRYLRTSSEQSGKGFGKPDDQASFGVWDDSHEPNTAGGKGENRG